MPNRILTEKEREKLFQPLISDVRARLKKLSRGDWTLLWALRRKLAKDLTYDERGTPMERRKLKAEKREQQKGKCAACRKPLPEKNAVLDRYEAMSGYTALNTRLICPTCDAKIQKKRGFA